MIDPRRAFLNGLSLGLSAASLAPQDVDNLLRAAGLNPKVIRGLADHPTAHAVEAELLQQIAALPQDERQALLRSAGIATQEDIERLDAAIHSILYPISGRP